MKQSLSDKITQVLATVPIVKNLARKDFFSRFILALIERRNVQFHEVARSLNESVKTSSNIVRIQDFFREVSVDFDQVAILLINLLPRAKKVRLCIDRTEWDFGKCQVNILMVVAVCDGISVPLFWELLDNKSGNSSSEARIGLLEKCVTLLGKERIGMVVGDREFVGHLWLSYLKDNGLDFVMRFPKHHKIQDVSGECIYISNLIFCKNSPRILKNVLIDGVVGDAWVKLLNTGDYLFLFGTVNVQYMGQLYRKRWAIEMVFQAFKTRGFNIENTHLNELHKLKKLIAFVSLAYAFTTSLGIYVHKKITKLSKKKHGYLAKSFTRKGIEIIQELCRLPVELAPKWESILSGFSRWFDRQLAHYQLVPK